MDLLLGFFFVAMVKRIVSLISLSDFLLLVYRNARDFLCFLINFLSGLSICWYKWSIKVLHYYCVTVNFPFYGYCCCLVTQSCPTLCEPMDCSMPGFPVLHHLPEFAQIHVHWVSDAIQPSLSPSSPLALNLSQHQGLFQWVSYSHQVAKVLERQLQHQSVQWIFRVSFRIDWFDLFAFIWFPRFYSSWLHM